MFISWVIPRVCVKGDAFLNLHFPCLKNGRDTFRFYTFCELDLIFICLDVIACSFQWRFEGCENIYCLLYMNLIELLSSTEN